MADEPHDWFETLEALGRGDRTALARLTELVTGLLTRQRAYEFRDSWEDVCQEVIVSVYKSYRKGAIREPRAFVGYARVVTRNALSDWIQRHRRPGEPTRGGDEDPALDGAQIEEIEQEQLMDLHQALGKLPDRTRQVLRAVYLEGRTYEEASQLLEIPLGTLKRVQTQGLKELRRELGVSPDRGRSDFPGRGVHPE